MSVEYVDLADDIALAAEVTALDVEVVMLVAKLGLADLDGCASISCRPLAQPAGSRNARPPRQSNRVLRSERRRGSARLACIGRDGLEGRA